MPRTYTLKKQTIIKKKEIHPKRHNKPHTDTKTRAEKKIRKKDTTTIIMIKKYNPKSITPEATMPRTHILKKQTIMN